MSNISDILGSNRRFSKLLSDRSYTKRLQEKWGSIVGNLKDQLFFSYMKNGVLYITTPNYMWVNEVAFYQDQIIDKVNAELKKEGARKKVFRIKVSYDEPVTQKRKVDDTTITSELDLETRIRERVERKRAAGQQLCKYCHEMYTDSGICTFCRVAREQPGHRN